MNFNQWEKGIACSQPIRDQVTELSMIQPTYIMYQKCSRPKYDGLSQRETQAIRNIHYYITY